MHRPNTNPERQTPLRHPGLAHRQQIVVDRINKDRHQHIGGTAGTRIHIRQRNRQQNQYQRGDRHTNTPQEFGTRSHTLLTQQLRQGQTIGREFGRLDLGILGTNPITFKFHDAKIEGPRLNLIAPPLFKHQKAVPIRCKLLEPFFGHHDAHPAFLRKGNEDIGNLGGVIGHRLDKHNTLPPARLAECPRRNLREIAPPRQTLLVFRCLVIRPG